MAALARRPAEPESSVTISRNAKGIAQFEVTVRSTSWEDALQMARDGFEDLCAAYPYPAVNGGTE